MLMTNFAICATLCVFRDPVSPAKKETQNQETTTSGQDTMDRAWAGSGRRTGAVIWKQFHMRAWGKLLDLDTPEGRQELIDEGLDGVKKAAQRVLDSDNPNIKEFLDDMETPDGLTGRQALEGAMEGDAGALVDVIIDGAVGLAAVE